MSVQIPTDRHVVVIGGGVAGLVAALECARIGTAVTVLEASDRLGGCVRTEWIAGVPIDTGAESFATRGGTVRGLIDEVGLADRVVSPNSEGAWLAFDDDAAPLPKAGVLGIPQTPLADDVRRIIGWRGAWRAYLDRVKPVLTIGKEHDLAALVRGRMGRRVLDSLVAPVTEGVYSSSPEQLDVALAAPGLNEALTVAGSLSGAVGMLRENLRAGSAVGGFSGGMRVLVDALAARLDDYAGSVRTASPATRLERTDGGWRVEAVQLSETEEGEERRDPFSLDADAVIVATPEQSARDLLAPHVPPMDEEPEQSPPEVDIVTLAIDSPELDEHPRGTGVLTARSAGRIAKALTHSTAKWPWLRDAVRSGDDAAHRHIVRVSFGRAGGQSPLAGKYRRQVIDLAREEAAALLGVPIAPEQVVDALRTSWSGTLPRAASGRAERSAILRDAIHEIGGLEATGAWLSGTGLASVIPDATAAADRVRSRILDDVLDSE